MQVGAAAHAVHVPQRPPAESTQAAAPDPAQEDQATSAVKGQAAAHALFQGQGNKTGIIKRLTTEEIQAVRSDLGIRAGETADRIVAERTAAAAELEDPAEVDPTAATTPASVVIDGDALVEELPPAEESAAPSLVLPEAPAEDEPLVVDGSALRLDPSIDPSTAPTGSGIGLLIDQAGQVVPPEDE